MAEIGAGMAQYWTQLEAAGISVTPIKESPDLVEDVPTCVDQHLNDLAQCDVPVSTAILQDSPVTDAAKLMNGKVTAVNENSLICGPQVYTPVVGNLLVYGDRHHLTGPCSYALLSEYPPGYSNCPWASTGPFKTFRTTASCAAARQFVFSLAEHSTGFRLNFCSQA